MRVSGIVLIVTAGLLVFQTASEALAKRPPRAKPDAPSTRPAAAACLELTLTCDKASYNPSEPILLALALKNTGTQAVWVVTRFYISAKEVPPQRRDVYVEVTSPSGQPLPGAFTHQTGFPKSDYFVQLQPGEDAAAEGPRNLRAYVELKEPGTYQVTAVYENVFGPELGLDTFRGSVRSAPATFTIAP